MKVYWKCSCGKEGSEIEKSSIIGITEFGVWFNCECKSTHLIRPEAIEKSDFDCPLINKVNNANDL
jgi:hypothetical protein